jgi:hypothetical protein
MRGFGWLLRAAAVAALAITAGAPLAYLAGAIGASALHRGLAIAAVVWFLSASLLGTAARAAPVDDAGS